MANLKRANGVRSSLQMWNFKEYELSKTTIVAERRKSNSKTVQKVMSELQMRFSNLKSGLCNTIRAQFGDEESFRQVTGIKYNENMEPVAKKSRGILSRLPVTSMSFRAEYSCIARRD